MTKRRQTIKIRLPRYEGNSLSWRKAIHEKLVKASTNIEIRKDDPIELIVALYFDKLAVHWHDVDNRLKDIMDALQGRLGGPKGITPRHAIVPNDNQIYRVHIEKAITPKQSLWKGHLIVKKYARRKITPNKAL
jgi:Holliday junction resolvase RusA-like endonuclease